jgi:uncharacterized protein (UPF0147 family)
MKADVEIIVQALSEMQDDASVPKNIKIRITRTIECLREECEISMRIDKALQELDEISDQSNLQPFTRTQIWNIVSMLEEKI